MTSSGISGAAITAAAADAWQAAQTATCPHHLYVICDDCWMTAAITAALPELHAAWVAEAGQLRAVIADLVGADPCWFDHHGYCQAHGWLGEGECPHARAKRLLSTTPTEERP